MSKAYTVVAGDTLASIARRSYGNEQYASNIAKANPGVVEPLTVGTVLAIPALPGAPVNKASQAPTAAPDEVAVLIDGIRFRFWSNLRITRALDGFDTVEFSAPFDPDAPGFRATFRPFSYKSLVITVGGDLLFTGTLIGVVPVLNSDQRTIAVSAYAVPGVLQDCTPPASAYPVEFNEVALPDIAAALAEPFGISVEFTGPPGAAFERAAVKPSDDIAGFLSDLARQRSLVMSNTPEGSLLFQQSVATGTPVAALTEGSTPVLGVTPSFSPQQYYSSITGLESVYLGTEGSQYTVKNPHLAGVVRPLTFESPDVLGGDISDAVAAKAGRMYGNMASYSVSVDTWRDVSGALWKPNTTVTLEAPGAMVYSKYEFIVRSVQYSREGDNESAELDLVLPGSFSGTTPEALPWD